MTKSTSTKKQVVKKQVVDKPQEVITYRLDAVFNGCNFTAECTDIAAGIKSFEPEQVFTDMFLTVTNGEHVMERHLPLLKARQLFKDPEQRELFINNLLLL